MQRILVASEAGITVRAPGDISDAIGACLGSDGLVLIESDLSPAFFDLKSGLAGELLQKFVSYGIKVALVVPDPRAYGQRFSELAHEHATHGGVRFVGSIEDAFTWLRAAATLSRLPGGRGSNR